MAGRTVAAKLPGTVLTSHDHPAGLVAALKNQARALGFELVGLCRPQPSPGAARAYRRWAAAGMAGEMGYLTRPHRLARALDPKLTLSQVQTLVVVGRRYGHLFRPQQLQDPSRGVIAAYACRRDYHPLMTGHLQELAHWLAQVGRCQVATRVYVDTGPILERDAGWRAGLGFVGRNTMLIHPRYGSWFLVGEILVDLELPLDRPQSGTCGECRRCLVACPTAAFAREYVLDARRCISYLTIELKGPIPLELRPALGNHIFGCDICNQVCPYNRRLTRRPQEAGWPPDEELMAPPLLELISLDEKAFRARFGHTPIARSRRRGLLRNVCVALGNWGAAEAVPALARALEDAEPLVRGHAAWALGRIDTVAARAALRAALGRESQPWVAREIRAALEGDG